jgi:hypothetical protein
MTISAEFKLAPIRLNALTVLIADAFTNPLAPVPNWNVISPDVAVIYVAETYEAPPAPIPVPLKVNPPSVITDDKDIAPLPAPVIVTAASDDNVVAIDTSELPVPLVSENPAETVTAEAANPAFAPKLMVTAPEAVRMSTLFPVVSSVDRVESKVNASTDTVVALKCDEPAPMVIEVSPPEIFVITTDSPLPIGLEKLSAPPVSRDEAVNEPLPAMLTVIPADALRLARVTSPFWLPVKLKVLFVVVVDIVTSPLPFPLPSARLIDPLALIPVLIVMSPEAAPVCVSVNDDVLKIVWALKSPLAPAAKLTAIAPADKLVN